VEPHDDAAVGGSAAPSTEVEGVDGVALVESLGNSLTRVVRISVEGLVAQQLAAGRQ
jgi:hypothetical protein